MTLSREENNILIDFPVFRLTPKGAGATLCSLIFDLRYVSGYDTIISGVKFGRIKVRCDFAENSAGRGMRKDIPAAEEPAGESGGLNG